MPANSAVNMDFPRVTSAKSTGPGSTGFWGVTGLRECVSVLLVGIGGYGGRYANALLDRADNDRVSLAGVVDPAPENYGRFEELRAGNIRVYGKMEDFYAGNRADLAVGAFPSLGRRQSR